MPSPRASTAQHAALGALRAARFRKRTESIDRFDAFYQAYVAAILVGIAVLVLSGAAGGDQLTTGQLADLESRLPALAGLGTALAVGAGFRSGSRGGPVALEAPDVRHVLSSPVPLGTVLRGPAVRQARFVLFGATIVGGVVGQLVARRTPGNPFAWTAGGALWAGLSTVAGLAAAVAVAAWPTYEVAADRARGPWSPFRLLGSLAIAPRLAADASTVTASAPSAIAAAATVVAIAVAAVSGLRGLGGVSVEAMARRSELVAQLRFAATVQDLRTVLLLRRQLLQERPRNRPWLGRARTGRTPRAGGVVARSLRSLARIPASRLARILALAIVGGLAGRGAFDGVVPLVVVCGLCAFLVALDLNEPLAQEIDHRTILDQVPVRIGLVHARLLLVPALAAVATSMVGAAASVAVGADGPGVQVAVTAAACLAITGTAGAAVSIVRGAPDDTDLTMLMLPPEAAGSRLVLQAALPPVVATLGAAPILLAGAAARDGLDPVDALGPGITLTAVVAFLLVLWLRARPGFRAQMAEMTRNGAIASRGAP